MHLHQDHKTPQSIISDEQGNVKHLSKTQFLNFSLDIKSPFLKPHLLQSLIPRHSQERQTPKLYDIAFRRTTPRWWRQGSKINIIERSIIICPAPNLGAQVWGIGFNYIPQHIIRVLDVVVNARVGAERRNGG